MHRRVAIFSATGIGDGLIMMIASYAFQKAGYKVITFNNHLASFGRWFRGFHFERRPSPEEYEKVFEPFDIIVVQHENSYQAKGLAALEKKGRRLILFYNNYRSAKHPPLEKDHFAFNEKTTMVENVSLAMQKLLKLPAAPKEIGLTTPEGLIHRKFSARILIHPTSSMKQKNWSEKKFFALCKKLQKMGFQPSILTSPQERDTFQPRIKGDIDYPLFESLDEVATYLYESGYFIGNDSGPGHLASYLHIPSLILAGMISHWRPGWKEARLVLPPSWAPNMKGPLRLRENRWQLFVSVSKVLKELNALRKK